MTIRVVKVSIPQTRETSSFRWFVEFVVSNSITDVGNYDNECNALIVKNRLLKSKDVSDGEEKKQTKNNKAISLSEGRGIADREI